LNTSRETYLERQQRALAAAASLKLDALLVSSLPNIRYLTGFTGDNALLLLEPFQNILFTDPRFLFQAQQESACRVRSVRRPLLRDAAAWIHRRKLRRVGIEQHHLTYAQFRQLDGSLPDAVELLPTERLVESLRTIKSPDEIALIRQSALLTCQALEQTLPLLRPGVSESDIAAELVYRMRKLGADGPAFDPIVAFGRNSALPHARPGANQLKRKDIILIDCGAFHHGYASDLTRVFFCGTPPTAVRNLHKAVVEAQKAALDAARPGVRASRVDQAARRVLRQYGLAQAFLHATGHGLGLEIHEFPRLGASERSRLEPGMAVTIEPGVYLQESGGIRIEDTVVIRENGCDVLTPASKELVII